LDTSLSQHIGQSGECDRQKSKLFRQCDLHGLPDFVSSLQSGIFKNKCCIFFKYGTGQEPWSEFHSSP
jgi:hypothetical protein